MHSGEWDLVSPQTQAALRLFRLTLRADRHAQRLARGEASALAAEADAYAAELAAGLAYAESRIPDQDRQAFGVLMAQIAETETTAERVFTEHDPASGEGPRHGRDSPQQ